MVFSPNSFRWLKQKKMIKVKVVYHPSNFLLLLKKHPVWRYRQNFQKKWLNSIDDLINFYCRYSIIFDVHVNQSRIR